MLRISVETVQIVYNFTKGHLKLTLIYWNCYLATLIIIKLVIGQLTSYKTFGKQHSSLIVPHLYLSFAVYDRIFETDPEIVYQYYHTGPSFNIGTENTIQVSKFKRIGFEKLADLDGDE